MAYNFGIYHGVFVCIHLSSVLLCTQDSYMPPFPNVVFAYQRVLEGKGRAEESELPCQRVNFPIQVCTSCLQFALCPRCVLTNQSVSVVLKHSAKCELKCLHCSLLSL